MRMRNSWVVGLSLAVLLRTVASKCYLPNGVERWITHGADVYRPSGVGSSVDNFQMCCATIGNGDIDVPRKDGLCDNPRFGGEVWRESCTDPTWRSPSCIKLCVNGTDDSGNQLKDVDVLVTQCPDKSYCCGDNNYACCDRGDGVWIRDGLPTKINPNATQTGASITTSGAATMTTAAAARPDVTPSPRKSGSLSGGAIAGIVVGSMLVVGVLGFVLWFFARGKRRHTTDDRLYCEAPVKEQVHISEKEGFALSEIDGMGTAPELAHRDEHPELMGSIPAQRNEMSEQRSELYGEERR
ncbi:MAG: hypothetical protein Q9200_001077 [Gallowayella weberi]